MLQRGTVFLSRSTASGPRTIIARDRCWPPLLPHICGSPCNPGQGVWKWPYLNNPKRQRVSLIPKGDRSARWVRSTTTAARVALISSLALSVCGLGASTANALGPVKSLLEMRQDRTVVQEWDLSCGAAALATLLKYQHGDPVPEKEIATQLIKREEYLNQPELVRLRQGFSLLDLKRYVDARDYEGNGYGRLTLDDLIERAPIMVPVNFYGYNHFVVFRGVRSDRVLLSDPAWGNRTMRVEVFENAWLQYEKIGKVGFVVSRRDGKTPPNQLEPRSSDFVMLR